MDEGLDTGDMLMKEVIPIAEDETGESLHDKLSVLGADMIVKALNAIEEGTLKPEPQTGETCYASMLKKEMGCIDWRKPADDIEHLVRGLYPWPGTYTFLNGKMMKICWVVLSDVPVNGEPGEVCEVTRESLIVNTGDGTLEIKELQPEGKKRMTVHDFLLGNKLEKGVCFGIGK